MKCDALTLDTQVFNKNSFDLDGGWLAQIKQFKGGTTQVVMSEIVARELVGQLADKIRQAKDKFEAATKDALHFGLDAQAAAGMKLVEVSPRTLADTRAKAYFEAIGAVQIPANLLNVDQLLESYFKPTPPFASSGKKKAEFPDAIALLSLEAWAKAHGKHILAVSGDGDWSAFGEKSRYIEVVPTIEDALAILQAHAEEARALVQGKLVEIDTDGSPQAQAFRALLEVEVAEATVHPDIETAQPAEVEEGSLSLLSFFVSGVAPDFDFDVVQVGSETIAASVDLRVTATASAYVSFSAWDSIDREYISLGGVTAEREMKDLEATVIATWERNLVDGEWELASVELVSIDDPNMGMVEMDWGHEGWDERE